MKTRIVAITTIGYLQLPKPHLTQEQTDYVINLIQDQKVTGPQAGGERHSAGAVFAAKAVGKLRNGNSAAR